MIAIEPDPDDRLPSLEARRRRRTVWLVLGMALGSVVALFAALVIWGIATRDSMPLLTRADLDAARAQSARGMPTTMIWT